MTHPPLNLTLALKGVFFDQIVAGIKTEEFRLCTPFWAKRLEGRVYEHIVLTRGYPVREDFAKRLVLPWKGFTRRTIQHDFFGPEPVEVYAVVTLP